MEPITHKTRRESNNAIPRAERERAVLRTFYQFGVYFEMTARQIVTELNQRHSHISYDINMIRPRLTELTDKGVLEHGNKVQEAGSRGSVATWRLKKGQGEMF